MSAQPKHALTEQEYLAFERTSAQRHEFFDGEIFAMAGGTVAHNLISGNVFVSLHTQLRGSGCRAFNSDMRLKIVTTRLYTYPDITVVCGGFQFTDDSNDTLTNPIVIIEILPPSTERYDRGLKFQNYRATSTLQEYLLISQHAYHIEHYIRQAGGQWLFEEAKEVAAVIDLPSIQKILALAEVYDSVDLNQENIRLPRDIPTDDGNTTA
jgi:Uma2 family endonuclease